MPRHMVLQRIVGSAGPTAGRTLRTSMQVPAQQPDEPVLSLERRKTINRVVILGAVAVATLFLAWKLRWAVGLVVSAMLVAVFFHAGARQLTKLVGGTGGRGLATFCLLLALLVAGVGLFMVPSLISESDRLVERLPQLADNLRSFLSNRPWGDWLLSQLNLSNNAAGDAASSITPGVVAQPAMRSFGLFVTVIVASVFLFFTGLYVAAEPGSYRRGILWMTPARHRRFVGRALREVADTLERWLYGQLAAMALVGLLSGLGLWILGVPLPLVCAVFTFTVCFVPNFGPVASVTPPALLALTVSPQETTLIAPGLPLMGAVIVLYIAIQVVESNIVTPLIQRRAVKLPPALLITAQLVAGLIAGVIGVVVAAPITAASLAVARVRNERIAASGSGSETR